MLFRSACNPDSPIAREADIRIEVIVGPEFVTGSTRLKSGTAEKLVLNMISTVTMIKLGRVKGNKMVNMQLSNAKLVDRGTRMLMEELNLDYEHAKNALLVHGSVKKAIEAFSKWSNANYADTANFRKKNILRSFAFEFA